jgi:hypothetical protein
MKDNAAGVCSAVVRGAASIDAALAMAAPRIRHRLAQPDIRRFQPLHLVPLRRQKKPVGPRPAAHVGVHAS